MTATKPCKILLAGGGTGGHIIPAIAIANECVRRGGEARFVGTEDRIEAKLVPEAGFGIDFVKVKPLVGRGGLGLLKGLSSVTPAVFKSLRLIGKLKPDVVLGVGGYVAGPVVLAARLAGIKTALLEQNAKVGLTNRILTKVVHRAYVNYESTCAAFPPGVAKTTGNPVPRAIVQAAGDKKSMRDDVVSVLVMGGSQGAKGIDTLVPRALALMARVNNISVVHQSRSDRREEVDSIYQEAGIDARVVPFIDDTAAAYRRADFVICRAGATTVSELTVMGLPAVFLPYPHHADKQQELNAQPMVEAGAAVVVDELEASEQQLADVVGKFISDPMYRRRASEASSKLGRPLATQHIVDGLEELVRGRR